MTLADITLPINLEHARGLALVFPADMVPLLDEAQQRMGDDRLRIAPRELTDGRYMVGADLLTEADGMLRGVWRAVRNSGCADQVEVMPWADAVAMLPATAYPGGTP
ncbi:MAG: hypothetical protein EBZ59_08540 [Planctomycetia bacterium]|nr:hypothetical protein [Planctomycetia bacterium]